MSDEFPYDRERDDVDTTLTVTVRCQNLQHAQKVRDAMENEAARLDAELDESMIEPA